MESSNLLHRLFEARSRKTPQNEALLYKSEAPVTYDQLNKSANRLAFYIRDVCPDREGVIALYLDKTPLLIIALLAVLKANMAWLPTPLDAPQPRVEHILSAVRPKLTFVSKSKDHGIAGNVRSIQLDQLVKTSDFGNLPDADFEGGDRAPRDLCSILFTSGSTGLPKGVMIEHRAVVHNARALTKLCALDTTTRTLQFAPYTFDIFGLDLFMTFLCGGCVVLAEPTAVLTDLAGFMRATKITYAQLTPTTIGFMDVKGIPSFKILVSSGESLTNELVQRWSSQVRLINAYGPTETIVCTTQEMTGHGSIDAACVGQPLPGLDVVLFEESSEQKATAGNIGEICTSGPQLFRGYVGDKKQEPFFWKNGKLFYRIGDFDVVQSVSHDQYSIRYLGRKDKQVKVHDIRVDLAEIEREIVVSRLVRHPVVVYAGVGPFKDQLHAVITLEIDDQSLAPNVANPTLSLVKPSPASRNALSLVQTSLETIL